MKWAKLKVEEFADVIGGGTPSTSNASFWDGDIPWITPKDLSGYEARFIERGERNITEEGLRKSSAQMLPAGAVLLSTRAPVGYVAIAENPLCTNQGFKSLISKPEIANIEFIYYLLKQNRSFLESQATGATYKELNGGRLRQLLFPIPPIKIQERIASILSAYDDLIENNQRRIKLLEESARQLYKEWFVRLRFPGYEHTKIIKGVPEGWEKKKLGDICQAVGGGTPSTTKSEYWENGDITWIIPSDITKNNCLVLLDSEKKITEQGFRNSSARMVPPETILMTSRASVGFFGLIDKEVCTNQGFISIIPNEDIFRMYLLHNLMFRREEILSKAGGTTYKEITKSTFREMEIQFPSKPLLIEFHEFVYDTIKQIRLLKKQAEKLKQARDLLLPKLMSGEVEV